jgi:hypothetical protein
MFAEQHKNVIKMQIMNLATTKERRIAAGQKELAEYLFASVPTINRWQADGKLDGCYTRIGRKIIYDLNKVDSKFSK